MGCAVHKPHPVCAVLKIEAITPPELDNQQDPKPKTCSLKLGNSVLLTLDGEKTQRDLKSKTTVRLSLGENELAACQAEGRGKKSP